MRRNPIDILAKVLVIIGGLNWGLIGLNAQWNVVSMIFGGLPLLETIIYILVGIAALYMLVALFRK